MITREDGIMPESTENTTEPTEEELNAEGLTHNADTEPTSAEATDAEQELAEAVAEPVEDDQADIAIRLARDTRDELAQALALRVAPGGGRGKVDPVHVERLTQRLQAYSMLALAEQGLGTATPGPGREGTLSISYYGGQTNVAQYDTEGNLAAADIAYADGSTATRGPDGVPVLEDRGSSDEGTPAFTVEKSVETTPEEGGSGSNVPAETPDKPTRAARKR